MFKEHLLVKTREDYDQIASDFSQTRKASWDEVDDLVQNLSEGASILDLGCGNGRLLEGIKLSKFDYLGIDCSQNLIQEAKRLHPGFAFKISDFTQDLNQFKTKFDYLVSIAALHHIPSKKLRLKVFRELRALLEKDGKLLFTVWNLHQPKYKKYLYLSRLKNFGRYGWNDSFIPWKAGKHKVMRYYHAFSKKELIRLLQKAGFKIEQLECSQKGNFVIRATIS